ncbi:MAG: DNA gyrase modulator, partial [Bdellovibrionales bacterium]|nr:DNA gyrase modulator [Bdellovibrionales bacterium]
MLSQAVVKKVLDAALERGAQFAEIFVEDTYQSELRVVDSKPAKALIGRLKGAGVRVFYGHEQIYVTTNDLSEAGLVKAARTAAAARADALTKTSGHGVTRVEPKEFQPTAFDELHHYGTRPWEYDRDKKFTHLMTMDKAARQHSSMVTQVEPALVEKTQRILVANSEGVWAEDERNYVRAIVQVSLEDQGQRETASSRTGTLGTSEWYDTLDFSKMATDAVNQAKLLIHADYAPAGEMPVVIDGGFG